jgi:hypothetical protein
MKEIGQVSALKGDMAEVRIERLLTTGGGCCVAETRETVRLEARNKCGAGIGDYVGVISDYDRIRFREIIKFLACAAVFVISMGIGNFLWPALGISSLKDPLSFALGGVMALAAFALIGAFNRKRPAFVPEVYEVIPQARAAGLLKRARLQYAGFDGTNAGPDTADFES